MYDEDCPLYQDPCEGSDDYNNYEEQQVFLDNKMDEQWDDYPDYDDANDWYDDGRYDDYDDGGY